MRRLIILGDGIADEALPQWGGKTPLAQAKTPNLDTLARKGRCGTLQTIPQGMPAGSEVANMAILGYDVRRHCIGRGALEAVDLKLSLEVEDIVLRCNLVSVIDGILVDHMGGGISTAEAHTLLHDLGVYLHSSVFTFGRGERYRHLLRGKGLAVQIVSTPPHEALNLPVEHISVRATQAEGTQTAEQLNDLMATTHTFLSAHPLNKQRQANGLLPANGIALWGIGTTPQIPLLSTLYPTLKRTAMITATAVMKGIAHYTGMELLPVEGATGLWDTNYEAKAQAAIDALENYDLVYLHIEAADEASHIGNAALKKQIIEDIDARLLSPVIEAIEANKERTRLAFLPDHATPCALKHHTAVPVPFLVYERGIVADAVQVYTEESVPEGSLKGLAGREFMDMFVR